MNKFILARLAFGHQKWGALTTDVQEAAADGHPVLCDNFYQHLLDIKGQIYTSVKLQALVVQKLDNTIHRINRYSADKC